jgi:hypothetical protein
MQPPPPPTDSDGTVEALTAINVQDMLEAAGLEGVRRGRRLLEMVCRPGAASFARQVAAYDESVGSSGLRDASLRILRKNIGRLEVAGLDNIPPEGPLLLVSNHPGLTDAVSLLSTIPRDDVRIVAADRPFLRVLGNTSRHLIYLGESEAGNTAVLRRVAKHLRGGGAVLIFPGGQIEPDPALARAASSPLAGWSKSIGLIVRLCGEIKVVPAIVSGVTCARARNHFLARLRREQKDRERMGAMIQILIPAYRRVTVRLAFGPALEASVLRRAGDDPQAITETIVTHTRRLIEQPPTNWKVIVHDKKQK